MIFRLRVRQPRPANPVFHHPVYAASRTALLHPGLQAQGNTRLFTDPYSGALQTFAPQSLAGTPDILLPLAKATLHGQFALPRLRHAIVCFLIGEEVPIRLRPADRELLWQAFGVPLFEQWRSPQGLLLAEECEAHHGLHLLSGTPHCKPWQLAEQPCACGRTEPRWLEAEVIETTPLRLHVASGML